MSSRMTPLTQRSEVSVRGAPQLAHMAGGCQCPCHLMWPLLWVWQAPVLPAHDRRDCGGGQGNPGEAFPLAGERAS
eukprot:6466690-Amphidinium_carterae.1